MIGAMLLTIAQWRLPAVHVKKLARVLSSVHAILTCSVCWTSVCTVYLT